MRIKAVLTICVFFLTFNVFANKIFVKSNLPELKKGSLAIIIVKTEKKFYYLLQKNKLTLATDIIRKTDSYNAVVSQNKTEIMYQPIFEQSKIKISRKY